jgi:hypothetical protein
MLPSAFSTASAPAVRTHKSSNDPEFEAKFWVVIGLYLDPRDNAPVSFWGRKERLPPGIGLRTKTTACGFFRPVFLTS